MELDLETNISIYKTLSRENKENIATHIYTKLVDGLDLNNADFSQHYPMRHWKDEIRSVLNEIAFEYGIKFGDDEIPTICRSLFDIMFKDMIYFYRSNEKLTFRDCCDKDIAYLYGYIIDINKRMDLQLNHQLTFLLQ
tara:strand:- start:2623 stop:3036 length:414 start_codon:yes stop_codon:yes gene_type:complete